MLKGFKACWERVLILGGASTALGLLPSALASSTSADAVQRLAAEVRGRGWIGYAARSGHGDWDLFVCRPDGSQVRPLTTTPEFNEACPQWSADGRRLLYRRVKRQERFDNNRYGEQGELVLTDGDGGHPRVLGAEGEWSWASWNPDGRHIASLSIKGITLLDVDSRQVLRKLDRKGFFQQLTWSPDGEWLVGVANSFGTGWSIARMAVATGEILPVNRVDCCTPDWFPDSRDVIFSWRPPGQKANEGYGWTQLWRADAGDQNRQLVYGEDGRHVYGGHVSPDGQYVLFTGNLQEDGDPGNAGAPMNLMRLSDAPIVGGDSTELHARYPGANAGPVLNLPIAWEPCWTKHEILKSNATGLTHSSAPARVRSTLALNSPASRPPSAGEPRGDEDTGADFDALTREVHDQGWIVFSGKTERGDWDLYRMRPNGSDRCKFAGQPEYNEGGARFSPDGKRVLFYRLPKSEPVQNNEYGLFELVIAAADGGQPEVFGRDYPWATWSSDGKQVACLTPKGIQIIDLASRQVVRRLPRQGIVSQLVWSPDGQSFTGTADHLGPFWNIASLNLDTGQIRAVSETDRYNCTPDWVADSHRIVYARGIIPQAGGRAELWAATLDGRPPQLLYAEAERHIYGACASPDQRYLLFTRSREDLTRVDHQDTTMAIIRWSDTPMRGDEGASLKKRLPMARSGPRLDLGPGWEPHWTSVDLSRAGTESP